VHKGTLSPCSAPPPHPYRPLDGTIKKSTAPYKVHNIRLRYIKKFHFFKLMCSGCSHEGRNSHHDPEGGDLPQRNRFWRDYFLVKFYSATSQTQNGGVTMSLLFHGSSLSFPSIRTTNLSRRDCPEAFFRLAYVIF
jgi:hypothetical protein